MSIAEDFKRGFVAVPAANYSTLLHRSIDFNPYLALSARGVPRSARRGAALALIQQLWDRAEPQGYMNHLVSRRPLEPAGAAQDPDPHGDLRLARSRTSAPRSWCARSASTQVTPVAPELLPDVPEMAAPFDGSAFVEVDPQRRLALQPARRRQPRRGVHDRRRLSRPGRSARRDTMRFGNAAAHEPGAAVQQRRARRRGERPATTRGAADRRVPAPQRDDRAVLHRAV